MNYNEFHSHRRTGRWWRRILLVAVLALCCTASGTALTIKLGSVAPANTPWDLALRGLAADWARISDGEIEVKIFPGGIAGNETDMIRKMRIGQLQAAAMTAISFNNIYPGVLAIAQPMLVRTDEEMRNILEEMTPFFNAQFEERGFVPLMWAPIGWVKFFAREPVRTADDLRRLKLWVGSASPAVLRAWQQAGFNPVALPLSEVTTGLQSGMIDAVASSPSGAASFQWFGIVPHMTDLRFTPLFGAVMISKRAWQRIPAELRPRLLRAATMAAQRVSEGAYEMDDLAVHVMKAHGLQVHAATAALEQEFQDVIARYFGDLIGDEIDPVAYELVIEKVAAYRARGGGN